MIDRHREIVTIQLDKDTHTHIHTYTDYNKSEEDRQFLNLTKQDRWIRYIKG